MARRMGTGVLMGRVFGTRAFDFGFFNVDNIWLHALPPGSLLSQGQALGFLAWTMSGFTCHPYLWVLAQQQQQLPQG